MKYFLREDMEKLEAQLGKAQSDLSNAGKAIGEGADGDSNTWHDNAAYDEAIRSADMWSDRVRDLTSKIADSHVVDLPMDTHAVQIGHIVVFQDMATQDKRTVRMGSYMCFRKGDDDITISYAAPLGQMLFGLRVGETRSGKLRKAFKTLKVIEIKMPE